MIIMCCFFNFRLVEQEIIIILQERLGECSTREGPNAKFACKPLLEEYEIAADNFETKCK